MGTTIASCHFILKISMREMECQLPHMETEIRSHAKVTSDFWVLDDKGDDGLHLIISERQETYRQRVSNAISSNRSRKAKTRFTPRLTPGVFLLIA